jgi:hypothetical protein
MLINIMRRCTEHRIETYCVIVCEFITSVSLTNGREYNYLAEMAMARCAERQLWNSLDQYRPTTETYVSVIAWRHLDA